MKNLRDIGREIKDRRKLLQITQEELAEISGVSLRSLKAIELGKGNPTVSQLNKVLEAIGLRIIIGLK